MIIPESIFLDALFLILADNSERSKKLVKEFLDIHEKNSNKNEVFTVKDDIVTLYVNLIKICMTENITQEDKISCKILLLKIKDDDTLKQHPVTKDLISDILTSKETIPSNQIDEYIKKIRNIIIYSSINDTTRKVFARNKMIETIQDSVTQEQEILKIKNMFDESLKSIEDKMADSAKATESYISFSDRESLIKSLSTYVEKSVVGLIYPGLQGLRRALGKRGGLGRGESAVFAACSHNFKSGMLLLWVIWAIEYNKFVVAPGKKALVYFVSLENEVDKNLMNIIRSVYGRVEKKHIDEKNMKPEQLIDWLQKHFSKFDVELIMDRYTPHEFTFGKFVARYNQFVEKDLEMVMFDLDYLSEGKGIDPGDTFSSQGLIQLIRENYLKFKNHSNQNAYLFTTGHQLTKKAEELKRDVRYPVKRFNPSLMADSSDVHRIVDCLIFLNIENNIDGNKFLTGLLYKNRGCEDTPESHKFFAYPFTEFGIEDDVDGPARYVTDIDAYMGPDNRKNEILSDSSVF